jgi:tRNA threonylcarbamoyl adenosine modification protein YeaZ
MAEAFHFLCLDLGSPRGSLALFRGETCLKSLVVSTGRDHSEQLLPELSRLLDKHGVALGDIGGYVLSKGPGSYTGLRVAFATFKAFAMVKKAPLWIVSGSEIRALTAAEGPRGTWKVKTRLTAAKILEEEFVLGPGETRVLGENEYELTAEMLGKYFREAKSLSVCETTDQLIAASPTYAGSSF